MGQTRDQTGRIKYIFGIGIVEAERRTKTSSMRALRASKRWRTSLAFNHVVAASIPARPTRTALSDQKLTNVATSRIADFPSRSCPVKRSGIVCTRHRPMRLAADVQLLRGLGSDVICIRFGWGCTGREPGLGLPCGLNATSEKRNS